jgi:Putative transposase
MTLETGEFIRRFLMHVLPKGFHRIRHYGLLANGGITRAAAGPGGCEPRLDALPNEIALELGEASHDRAHQFAARCAQVERQASLRQHADLPAVQVIKSLVQVLCAPAPAAQLGDQNCVNFVIPSERHDLLTLDAIVSRS